MPLKTDIRVKTLLWSDRHCCLCKKVCGVNIEVHHIVPEGEDGSDDIDNAIPLCYDCHSEVMRYNNDHPRGNKYRREELVARREQVYEEFTRHLVPPINVTITQKIPGGGHREFPDVGFILTHLGDSLPVKCLVTVGSVIDGRLVPIPKTVSIHYSGNKVWNINPRYVFSGHFKLPLELTPNNQHLELRVALKIIDQYDREHSYLPIGFIYDKNKKDWYAEP